MKRIVVLISGNGSNLQAIIDNSLDQYQVSAVFSNQKNAYGLTRASQSNIATHFVNPKNFPSREQFDIELASQIDVYQPDLIVLAGYMRILSDEFVQHYQGKMLNIHPSLLPKYTGLHTHQRAIDAKDNQHGTTIHFVNENLDSGAIILQAKVPVFSDDTVDTLNERIQIQEHRIYPLVINWFINDRLSMSPQGEAILDGQILPKQGYAAE